MGVKKEYRKYFAALAKSHAELGAGQRETHFALASYQDFKDSLRSKMQSPYLVLEPCDVEIKGPNEGQLFKKYTGAVWLCIETNKRNATAIEIDDATDKCMEILDQIIAKMRQDAQVTPLHPLLNWFEAKDTIFDEVDDPDFVGYRWEFSFQFAQAYPVNNAIWL